VDTSTGIHWGDGKKIPKKPLHAQKRKTGNAKAKDEGKEGLEGGKLHRHRPKKKNGQQTSQERGIKKREEYADMAVWDGTEGGEGGGDGGPGAVEGYILSGGREEGARDRTRVYESGRRVSYSGQSEGGGARRTEEKGPRWERRRKKQYSFLQKRREKRNDPSVT